MEFKEPVKDYSAEEREQIKQEICELIDKSFEVNKHGRGAPLWMNLKFILDRFNQGNYYGVLELKITATSCNDVRERERTHKVREIYADK